MYRCINSWASVRFLCEPFRNKSSQAKSKAKDAADKEYQSKEGSTVTEDNVIEESMAEEHAIKESVMEDTSNEDAASVGLCDNFEDRFEDEHYGDEQNYLLYSQDEDTYLSYHEDYEEGDYVQGNNNIKNIEYASPSVE